MAEYSANAIQTVNPGETVVFTASRFPYLNGFIRHRDESGNFLLSGNVRSSCCRRSVPYLIDFGANIGVPTGGTVDPISLAITLDGDTIPSSQMIFTPAAVEEFGNVSRAINADVWRGCCETVSVRNTSDQPILVQNANIIITPAVLGV